MSQSVFQLFLTQRLAALAGADSLRAIREGLLWLLPCLLVSTAFLILSACARLAGLPVSRRSGGAAVRHADRPDRLRAPYPRQHAHRHRPAACR